MAPDVSWLPSPRECIPACWVVDFLCHFSIAFLHNEGRSWWLLDQGDGSSHQSPHQPEWHFKSSFKTFFFFFFKAAIPIPTVSHKLKALANAKEKYSSGSCIDTKAGLFCRSPSGCCSDAWAQSCSPLFKPQSKQEVCQRKACEIRSSDLVAIPLYMKGTLFSNTFHSCRKVSSSCSSRACKMRLFWGCFVLWWGLRPPGLPALESTPSSAHIAMREDGTSLTETTTQWIVLHYLRDNQERFNKYITHCIKK